MARTPQIEVEVSLTEVDGREAALMELGEAGATMISDPEGRQNPYVAVHPECETREVSKASHSAVVVFSTSNFCQRDGCILEARGVSMTNYRKNPVVLWAHDYRSLPIANSPRVKFVDERGGYLVGFPKFNMATEMSREVWALLEMGHLRAWSLGFEPMRIRKLRPKEVGLKPPTSDDEDEYREGDGELDLRAGNVHWRIVKSDLLEYSSVPVPADPSALTEALRTLHDGGRSAPTLEHWLRERGFDVPELVPTTVRDPAGVVTEITPASVTTDDHITIGDNSAEGCVEVRVEEMEDYIHVPVCSKNDFDADTFRTISISKPKGIQAVIGKLKGKVAASDPTHVQKYLFSKDKDWTVAKAKEWVAEHKKGLDDWHARLQEGGFDPVDWEYVDCDGLVPMPVPRGVIPFKAHGTAEEGASWDAGKEVKGAEIEDLRVMCAWYDSSNAEIKSAYKFPHHRRGDKKAVWRAVTNAVARLGRSNIPAKDKPGVLRHLHGHYKEFGKEVPEEKAAELQGRAGKTISKATAERLGALADKLDRIGELLDDVRSHLRDMEGSVAEPVEVKTKGKKPTVTGAALDALLASGR